MYYLRFRQLKTSKLATLVLKGKHPVWDKILSYNKYKLLIINYTL